MTTARLLRSASAFAQRSWTCSSCLRPSLPQQPLKRSLHSLPLSSYSETFEAKGVNGLYSPSGYRLAWLEYQSILMAKLNELTAGEPIENSRVKDLVIMFARDPMNASLFNHASAAYNNHQFFSTLAPAPLPIDKCPQLQESFVRTFGSIETLRATMLDTAAAMFGPGYVWLVWARNVESKGAFTKHQGNWRILTTYLAGTPFPEAGYRQQGIDMATNNANSYADYMAQQQPANAVGSFGPYSEAGKETAKLPPGATGVQPVLCVSTWEHSYIYDYGLKGKRKFLNDWWNAVDWGAVEPKAPNESKPAATFIRK